MDNDEEFFAPESLKQPYAERLTARQQQALPIGYHGRFDTLLEVLGLASHPLIGKKVL